jgi:hypothetical protein
MRPLVTAAAVCVLALGHAHLVSAFASGPVWTRLDSGGSATGQGTDVDPGAGVVYVCGSTSGVSGFHSSTSGYEDLTATDATIASYDQSGSFRWAKREGFVSTSVNEAYNGVAAQIDSSDVYAVGSTDGGFNGGTNNGDKDTIIARHSKTDGTLVNSFQLGGGGLDALYGVANGVADTLYVCGSTSSTMYNSVAAPASGVDNGLMMRVDTSSSSFSVQWTFLDGVSSSPLVFNQIAVDTTNGRVAACGTIQNGGVYAGAAQGGGDWAIVMLSDSPSSPSVLWRKQIGGNTDDV